MNYIFIMVAVSTFKIKDAEVIEISGLRTTDDLKPGNRESVLAAFTSKIAPKSRVESDAGKACNYSIENWIDAIPFQDAISDFKTNILAERFGKSYTVVTHLTDLSRMPLRTEFERRNYTEELFAGHAWIDVAQLAFPMVYAQILKSRTIEGLAEHFKVKLEPNGDTADKCQALLNIYMHMMRRYTTALTGEQAIRDVGGETLESFRRMVGI